MRRGRQQPFSPVCVSWVRRLLKEGGEGAGAGAGATGAALFLRLLRGWSSSGFLADLPLIFALASGNEAYYTFINPSEMRCFNQVLLFAKGYAAAVLRIRDPVPF
jgi:hypothetical protein